MSTKKIESNFLHEENDNPISWKIESYFKSMEKNAENSLCVEAGAFDENLEEKNYDAKSTNSSIESLDAEIYPSESACSTVEKIKKEKLERPTNLKNIEKNENDDHSTSSVESMNIIMYSTSSICSEIKTPKDKTPKRSAVLESPKPYLHKKVRKVSKSLYVKSKRKKKSDCKIDTFTDHDSSAQISSQVNESSSVKELTIKKSHESNYTSDAHKIKSDASQSACLDEVQVNTNLDSSAQTLLPINESSSVNKLTIEKSDKSNYTSDDKIESVASQSARLDEIKLKVPLYTYSKVKNTARKSMKKYKSPSLSDNELETNTELPVSNSEPVKQSTVKRRNDSFGSRMKPFLQDLTEFYARPADFDCKKHKSNIKNGKVKLKIPAQSIETNQSSVACSEKAATSEIPILKKIQQEKSIHPNSSLSNEFHKSKDEYEKVEINPLKIKFRKISKDFEAVQCSKTLNEVAGIQKDNNMHLTQMNSQSEYEIVQMNSSSFNFNEHSENQQNLRQNRSYPQVSQSFKPNPIQNSGSISNGSLDPEPEITSKNYYYYKLTKKIVEMNPKWLKERENNDQPPTYLTHNLVTLPLSFDSYDMYAKIFLQMILLEVWETICYKSEPYVKSNSVKKFYFSVLSYQYEHNLMKLHCESLVNRDDSFSPSDDNLIILDLYEENKTLHTSFGLILNTVVGKIPPKKEILSSEWHCFSEEWLQNSKTFKFDMYVKSRQIVVARNILMVGNRICSLEDKMQLTEALHYLSFSPMVDCILFPNIEAFSVNYSNDCHSYDLIQKKISSTVCHEMTYDADKKKIILLEGPPGSGKTSVIARVCNKLIKNCPSTKILVTAPSICALDSIAEKMIEFNEREGTNYLTFVHTSDHNFIHPNHLHYSLYKKLEEAKSHAFHKWELDNSEIQNRLHHLKMTYKENQNYESEIADLRLKSQELDDWRWDDTNEAFAILNSANIILSTFSDCLELHKAKIKFSCCIIDEVNQATEPETLYPFIFNNCKFFMLGDNKQLPPIVKSELAIKKGFQQSIMQRFQTFFKANQIKSPVIELKTQFRMHGEISKFPIKTFYFHDYIPFECSYFLTCTLVPYLVINDIREKSLQISSVTDPIGSDIIINLCKYVAWKCPEEAKGLIIPSASQKDFYVSIFEKLTFKDFEVGTVDSFQGREKIVCILSCYHESLFDKSYHKYFNCKRRMNVSLTRASHSLIICGPLSRLDRLPYWHALKDDAAARHCYFPYSESSSLFEIYDSLKPESNEEF